MYCTWNAIVRGIVCAGIILYCASTLPAVEFAGGTGEPDDPYQIATAGQLIAIGSGQDLAKHHFELVADIDLSGAIWSEPVIPLFEGRLNGNGHTIRGLTARGVGPQGLFGHMHYGARVRSLHLVDVDLIGATAVGALVTANYGTIQDCSSAGKVVSAASGAGGLVGYNNGTITGSGSTADVVGHQNVGGLVGSNESLVLNCRSAGVVVGSSAVGGLVGNNDGIISSSYSASEIIGGNDLGGLVGYNRGGIFSCYAAGTVAGGTSVGGLAGHSSGTISRCYSLAGVTGQATSAVPSIGGLVGRVTSSAGRVRDSYFLAPADGGGPDNKLGTPLTAAAMLQQASFARWSFWGTDGIGNHWFMPPDLPPVLTWQTEVTGLQPVPDVTGLSLDQARAALAAAGFLAGDIRYDVHQALPAERVIHADPSFVAPAGGVVGLVLNSGAVYDWAENPGDGAETNPYQIQTAGQLESLADHPELWDRHFLLTADLDMVGRTYSMALIAPDVNNAIPGFQGVPFAGTFDGQGHMICNLAISASGRDYVGLFGMIDQAGRISRLNLLDVYVRGTTTSASVGVLAGHNLGTISDCSVVGSALFGRVSGDGLVGVNLGNVIDCYADIAVAYISGGTIRR
jgi:hypothetical protein